MEWLNIFWFVIACIILVQSCGYLVRALLNVSSYLGLNEFSIGFIILAVSTSLPELFIGIVSALKKTSDLALGNVIGSNIVDLTLIIGLVTLLVRGIRIRSKIIRRDMVYMMLVVVLPIIMMLDQSLSRIEGGLLLGIFCMYILGLIKQERSFRREIMRASKKEAVQGLTVAAVTIAILLLSSYLVVFFAKRISADFNIPTLLIGLLLVAIGTSLPDLVFQTRAVLARHEEMAIGDLIGAVITNSTLVLGVSALIHPITTNFLLFSTSAIFMSVVAFIFLTFAESDYGLDWKEGISLVMLYIFFVIVESYLQVLQAGVK